MGKRRNVTLLYKHQHTKPFNDAVIKRSGAVQLGLKQAMFSCSAAIHRRFSGVLAATGPVGRSPEKASLHVDRLLKSGDESPYSKSSFVLELDVRTTAVPRDGPPMINPG